jgi:hypothetical protein
MKEGKRAVGKNTGGGSRERPILFSAPMIHALQAGRKQQTRRVMNPQPTRKGSAWQWREWTWERMLPEALLAHSPYGRPGDRLWVKEVWAPAAEGFVYRADAPVNPPERWKSPLFLPRRASRLVLHVQAVRAEPLQDVSEADARAEGVPDREAYRALWDSINAERGHAWADNPWVWVVTFASPSGRGTG